MPMERLRPARSWRAGSFGIQPSFAIASSTRRRVGSATMLGEFKTFDTVPSETPASAATSFMLTVVLRAAMRRLTPSPELNFVLNFSVNPDCPINPGLNYTTTGQTVFDALPWQWLRYRPTLTMAWRQAAFDLDNAGALNDDLRPAIFGGSHAAIGSGQVPGPTNAH